MLNMLIPFILTFLYTSCSLFNCVKGSGNINTETRPLTDFKKIIINSNANVYIEQDDYYSVDIEAEENIIPYIKTRIRNDELIISNKTCLLNQKPINIYISSPEFRRIALSSSGKIISKNRITGNKLDIVINGSGRAEIDLDVQKLFTELSGSGKISLRGNAYTNKINLSGSGIIDALECETDESIINLSGSGICKMNVNEDLKINISGSGIVEYIGSPDIQSNISGTGRVKKLRSY